MKKDKMISTQFVRHFILWTTIIASSISGEFHFFMLFMPRDANDADEKLAEAGEFRNTVDAANTFNAIGNSISINICIDTLHLRRAQVDTFR